MLSAMEGEAIQKPWIGVWVALGGTGEEGVEFGLGEWGRTALVEGVEGIAGITANGETQGGRAFKGAVLLNCEEVAGELVGSVSASSFMSPTGEELVLIFGEEVL